VAWIKDPETTTTRRRLYLTMLGVCGQRQDVAMLESMITSPDEKQKRGLDAMIACYLMLTGADGMPLVEELFLRGEMARGRKVLYQDTYAAIQALRFHGEEASVIERRRLLSGLRHMLDRPLLADLVIPDLARWQDWTAVEPLVKLFKEADAESRWVRVPVVRYLQVCPLPAAKKHLQELSALDPGAARQALTFPFGGPRPAEPKSPQTAVPLK